MTTSITRKQISTRLIFTGGAATKLGQRFETVASNDGLKHLKFSYVDTSASDLSSAIEPEKLFLVRNMDGGGKDRRMTYQQILPHVPEILQKFPAEDFNIIVHSASGGSGSAIGPALLNKLLEEGKNVVVVCIGSIASKKEVENTIGVIKTNANFAQMHERPVVMYYRENNQTNPRSKVDGDVMSALFMLSLLFSSENNGLDTADLKNLLDYNKVTNFNPELSSFDFFSNEIAIPDGLVAQSAAVLFSNKEGAADVEGNLPILEYRAEGFLSAVRTEQLGNAVPVYGVVYTGDFVERLKDLEAHRARFEAAEASRKNEVKSVPVSKAAKSDGMVF